MESESNQNTTRTALIAGATGLIGSHCLLALLNNDLYAKVVVVTRRSVGVSHIKLQEIVVDFDQLSTLNPGAVDDVYCCLGSTIKKAGSQEKFRQIDYAYPLALAEVGLKNGVQRMMVVSAVGADADSRVFYNRIKGELERDLRNCDFRSLHIFQPSLLLGDRDEFRLGERVGEVVMKLFQPFFRGSYAKYHAIKGATVAEAMLGAARDLRKGAFVHQYTAIQELAKNMG